MRYIELMKDILFKQINVGISVKSTNTIHFTKPKTTNNIQEQKCVEFTNSHAVHVNYHMSDRQVIVSNRDTKNTLDT